MKIRPIAALTFLGLSVSSATTLAQQPGMVDNHRGGQYFDAEQYKIDRMKVLQVSNTRTAERYEAPTEFENGAKYPKSTDDVWIGGHCRYAKPRYSNSRYGGGMSESTYCDAKYPKDTMRWRDNFDGKGTIPWAADATNADYREKTNAFLARMGNYVNDGLPLNCYDTLTHLSGYSYTCQTGDCYKEGRDYEFSRAWHVWLKRVEGSEKTYLEINSGFAASNNKDAAYFSINDRGQYKLVAYSENADPTRKNYDGKAKNWRTGEWNEVTVSKDQYNTVTFFINGEYLMHYQMPHIPIATRFAEFNIKLPYYWEKEGLKYNVGEVMVESFPQKY